jgi:glycosyltransferase involved in cell wall biosynthesis
MSIKKLSIVIPAYNEGATVQNIMNKIKSVRLIDGIQKEVILVNDFSTDRTEEVILQYIRENPDLNIQYFKH